MEENEEPNTSIKEVIIVQFYDKLLKEYLLKFKPFYCYKKDNSKIKQTTSKVFMFLLILT